MQKELNTDTDSNPVNGFLVKIFDKAILAFFSVKEDKFSIADRVQRERFIAFLGPEIEPFQAMKELIKEPETCRVLRERKDAYKAELAKRPAP